MTVHRPHPPARAMRENPDIDQLRRQARELLEAYRAQSSDAVLEVDAYHRNATPDTFALHDAQFVLARAYGFESWPKLKAAVEGVTTTRLYEAVKKGDLDAVRALLARRPKIVDLLPGGPSGPEIRTLHIAVMARDVEMTRLLLEAGADTRGGIWPNRDATSPRTIAEERGYDEIVSFTALLRLDLGFDPRGVLTFNFSFSEEKYDTKEKQWALIDAVLDSAKRLPGAVAAGAVFQRPFVHGAIGMDSNVVIEGQPLAADSSSRNPILNWEAATPDYFRAMDIQLLRGRLFDERDTAKSPPVVIIGQSLAARLWPGQDPIGKRMLAYGAPGDEKNPGWQTVVGVVEDARYREVEAPRFDLYLPYRQAPNQVLHFVVRLTGDPFAAVPALRTAVAALDPDARVDGISTMEEVVGRAFAPWRFSTIVVSAFGAIALTFAAVGIAALVAFAVAQRTREIGVRVALGAQTRDVVALVASEGARIALAGLVIGVLAAWILRRSVESMLFGIAPDDPVTFGAVALLLVAVSLVAAYLPARSAARVDPATALRAE